MENFDVLNSYLKRLKRYFLFKKNMFKKIKHLKTKK